MKIRSILAILTTVMFCSTASAESIVISSGKEKNQMIELYTSEGCSSCPPADRWISQLKSNPRLWDDIIPIAFHVDYWDGLGWKDELASHDYSLRQRLYREEGGLSQVYTPGFVVDGQEWRGFFRRRNLTELQIEQAGELLAEVADESVSIEFSPLIETESLLLIHVAVLGFDITNEIKAGENSGKTLTHDFAVLGYVVDQVNTENGKFNISMELPVTKIQAQQMALVIWVSETDNQAPLQVAGSWL